MACSVVLDVVPAEPLLPASTNIPTVAHEFGKHYEVNVDDNDDEDLLSQK